MVRNFSMVKLLPLKPHRRCRNSAGPGRIQLDGDSNNCKQWREHNQCHTGHCDINAIASQIAQASSAGLFEAQRTACYQTLERAV